MKQGRKTIMTPEVIDKLEEAFLLGASDIEACLNADISPATLYNYQEREPDFLERKKKLKQAPFLKARKAIISAFEKDPNLALKYMERKKKDEFSTKTEQDIKVEQVTPILGGTAKADNVHTDDSDD